ncbi:MAG TPA: DUF2306 domain-containing protein [Xanthobacteraceae bacterium]|jgi:hypothetical protein
MASIDQQDVAAEPLFGRAIDAGNSAAARLWATRALVGTFWLSAAIFGLYIFSFYAGAAVDGTPEQWNESLPRLYEPHTPVATIGIAAHFATGAVLLLLGPMQLMASVRENVPQLHRWVGRVYGSTALITGFGGLAFIALNGTIGGAPMNVGFGIYGALTVLAAFQTIRCARARRFDQHRAWAIRLFALAIGSWLYRMDYGFWRIAANGIGHTRHFDGPFDMFMAFFFYIPNLLVAEVFIRARQVHMRPPIRQIALIVVSAATIFIAVGTYYFTVYYWGPRILARVIGSSV